MHDKDGSSESYARRFLMSEPRARLHKEISKSLNAMTSFVRDNADNAAALLHVCLCVAFQPLVLLLSCVCSRDVLPVLFHPA